MPHASADKIAPGAKMALGFGIGLALDSIPIGATIGVGLGTSLRVALSRQRREPSMPMTIAGVVLVGVGIVVPAVVTHLVRPQWWCQYPILNLIPGC